LYIETQEVHAKHLKCVITFALASNFFARTSLLCLRERYFNYRCSKNKKRFWEFGERSL